LKTFEEATDSFINGLEHVGGTELAAITALQHVAISLDANVTPSMVAEYTKLMRYLRTQDKVTAEDDTDSLLDP
jgi:hypothetical protein